MCELTLPEQFKSSKVMWGGDGQRIIEVLHPWYRGGTNRVEEDAVNNQRTKFSDVNELRDIGLFEPDRPLKTCTLPKRLHRPNLSEPLLAHCYPPRENHMYPAFASSSFDHAIHFPIPYFLRK